MKSFNLLSHRLRATGLRLALVACVPALLAAADPAPGGANAASKAPGKTVAKIDDSRSDEPETNQAETKAALAQIDADLDRLDRLADTAAAPAQKAEAKARYAALNDRRNELKKQFTRARFETLKADLRAEMDGIATTAKETVTPPAPGPGAPNITSATAESASEKIAIYRVDASTANKADVKAALARLDADIEMLDATIDSIADPASKSTLRVRFKALKERRSELNSEFRKARYDALVADVKDEWNKLVH